MLSIPKPSLLLLYSPTDQTMTISSCFFSLLTQPIPVSNCPQPVSNDSDSQSLLVVSFYKFADFPGHAHMRTPLKDLCQQLIVTLGMPSVSPTERVGKYASPRDWNALISDPDTVVIDVRNNHETRIGKFKGAVDPCMTAFRKFPSWVED